MLQIQRATQRHLLNFDDLARLCEVAHGDRRQSLQHLLGELGMKGVNMGSKTMDTDAMTSTARVADDFDGPAGVFAVADRMAGELLRFSA